MTNAETAPDPSSRAHVLLVEDDPGIAALVDGYLSSNGFACTVAPDGVAMDAALAREPVDAVVLDLNLPGEDGLEICRRLRVASSLPVIIVTARGQDVDRIVGLELGADDYLGKPFNPRELLARLRAVLRRSGGGAALAPRVQGYGFEGWRLDLVARRLHDPDGVRVALTSGEFDLLATLCARSREVLPREVLLALSPHRGAALDRSVDVLVSRLRQKIERDPRNPERITTVRLGGYLFTPDVRPW
jgi:two-component system OmpR family response regulator